MKQGDIIWLGFDPAKGREQAGYRPALVISNTKYNQKRDFAIVCPITSKGRALKLQVSLDDRTHTQGSVICEQVKTIDLLSRTHKVIESIPKDLLKKVLEIVSVIISLGDDE